MGADGEWNRCTNVMGGHGGSGPSIFHPGGRRNKLIGGGPLRKSVNKPVTNEGKGSHGGYIPGGRNQPHPLMSIPSQAMQIQKNQSLHGVSP
jgi:hypothetical protein